MLLDIRVAFRHLAKSPGATVLSVLSIALGIGLTTSIFSVADAMLLRPIAVERPRELLQVNSVADDGQFFSYYGWPDYQDMTKAAGNLVTLVAYTRRSATLAGPDDGQTVLTHSVTPNYFSVLGVRAQTGITTVDDIEGRPAAVLGYRLWQRRFGGDPHLVGKSILLNRKAFLVAGVMPPEFTGLMRGVTTDVWIGADAWFHVFGALGDQQSRNGQFEMVARLKPGVSAPHAAAVLDAAIRGEGKHKPAPAGSTGTFLESSFALGVGHPSWPGTSGIGWTVRALAGAGRIAARSARLPGERRGGAGAHDGGGVAAGAARHASGPHGGVAIRIARRQKNARAAPIGASDALRPRRRQELLI